MQQQPPTNEIAHQGIIQNPEGIWCFKCKTCSEVFTSSQGLAGHTHKHKNQGTWIRGAPHEKFFCPSGDLPALYSQLGKRKSTPTVLPGQGRFYRPRPRNPVVQGPRRLPGRPRSILNQSQQPKVLQALRVAAPAPVPVTPPHIQDPNLFDNHLNQLVRSTNIDDQEELDLELRL